MRATLSLENGRKLGLDLSSPVDLSARISFDEEGFVEAFSLPRATRAPVVAGGFVGDTRRGGSCNCETITLTAHGGGTHTEGIGHLLDDRLPVIDLVDDGLILASLVSVATLRLGEVGEEVWGKSDAADQVVSRRALEEALARLPPLPARALVVRTPGGALGKRARRYSGTNPPYLTVDAARLLRARGLDHVLVDLPSLDREDDGGELGAHRAFFEVPRGARAVQGPPPRRSVTELVVVPDEVQDGHYALSLQLPPIPSDAVPSRPLLFRLEEDAP